MRPDTTKSDAAAAERYATVNQVCEQFSISRSTFYRMIADPNLGLAEVVVRIPPETGRIRVPVGRFAEWLHGAKEGGA